MIARLLKPRARFVLNAEKSYWIVRTIVGGVLTQGVGFTLEAAYWDWRREGLMYA